MLSKQQVSDIRKDFPSLDLKLGKDRHPLVYLDNAATTQKPRPVIDALARYYTYGTANPHRGAHYLANQSTELYEHARRETAKFIHAYRVNEIVFTRNATESLNALAYAIGLNTLEAGDEIVISILEHHANIVPWQMVAEKTGAVLKYVYIDDGMHLSHREIDRAISDRTKIVSLTGCSNVTGSRPDLAAVFGKLEGKGIIRVADLSQLVPHTKVDVRELHCDFAVFSAHKMYAAMGLGVLWGKYDLLSETAPFLLGGDMIEHVSEQHSTFAAPATRFEAGTMNVGAAVSLEAAIKYLNAIGPEEIDAYEARLAELALDELAKLPYIDTYAVDLEAVGEDTAAVAKRGAVVPFNVKDVHPHDVATILDTYGIAVRSGHHCAEPLHHYLNENATCRASFSFYNTEEEVMKFVDALKHVRTTMGLA